jgi:hypothetical protein
MYLFHIFRSFLPLHNTIGFGAIDFVELLFAACLAALLFAGPVAVKYSQPLRGRPGPIMLGLGALPILLRLALLPHSPAPTPSGADDFSYLLLADTLAHFRLANPTHPLYRFFETNFVLQQPTYSSIFPLGQGILLALGHALFGFYWAGVLLSIGILCAFCYWMLRGWTAERWAVIGGLLAVMQFGPLNQWTNCYWGGAVSAIAGCLVFGALPRLRARRQRRDAIFLGIGLGLQLLTRPFEFALLCIGVAFFFVPQIRMRSNWRNFRRHAAIVLLAFFPAVALTALQNKSVTGNWTTLPYMLSRYQYGVPATFTFQPNAQPHRQLTPEQLLDYRAQAAIHGSGTDSISEYLRRLFYRVRYYRFFFLLPLFVVLPAAFLSPRRFAVGYSVLAALIFAFGTNFYPYFYPHYIAALTSIFLLISVIGLERLPGRASAAVLLLCGAQFLFWYSLHLIALPEITGIFRFEASDYINMGDPQGRIAVNEQLARTPGKQLVIVHYSPAHGFHEWIHNAASLDEARVVWALDLGSVEDSRLISYFPDRKVWFLTPDSSPPHLKPYDGSQPF